MTATLNDVTKRKPAEASAEQQAAAELVRLAREAERRRKHDLDLLRTGLEQVQQGPVRQGGPAPYRSDGELDERENGSCRLLPDGGRNHQLRRRPCYRPGRGCPASTSASPRSRRRAWVGRRADRLLAATHGRRGSDLDAAACQPDPDPHAVCFRYSRGRTGGRHRAGARQGERASCRDGRLRLRDDRHRGCGPHVDRGHPATPERTDRHLSLAVCTPAVGGSRALRPRPWRCGAHG